MMLLKFIGTNGSMGFKTGMKYPIKVYSKNNYIWIETESGVKCPYSSPQSFAENWEGLNLNVKKVF